MCGSRTGIRWTRLVLLGYGLAWILWGCTSGGGLQNVTRESYEKKSSGQSLVIGRLDFRQPKELGLRMPSIIPRKMILLTRTSPGASGSENLFHKVGSGGYFHFLLSPGDYKISQVSSDVSTLSRSGTVAINTDLPFRVPENKDIYIGTITVDYTLTLLGQVTDSKISVADNYDEAMKKLKEEVPFVQTGVENRTIKASP